ncbi:MAG: DUF928 domain-containing protein [Gammaproteobacteria bacterium]|nr:DUF928 domain-containing protein [Gammaproteobacteria bacterium]
MYILKKEIVVAALCFFMSLLLSGVSYADNDGTENKPDKETEIKSSMFVYKPPLRGAPKTRVGAGVRGTGSSDVVLQIIVPEGTGLTLRSKPVLYWYSENVKTSVIEFSLIDDNGIDPVLEVRMENKGKTGLNKIDLSGHNIELKQGMEYQWAVAAVYDDKSRSGDVFASGTLRMSDNNSELKELLKKTNGISRVSLLLENGIWYDAFDEISVLINADSNDKRLKEIRNVMLTQIGLEDVRDKIKK